MRCQQRELGRLEPGCWQDDKKIKTVVTVQLMSHPLFDVCHWMMHIKRDGALMAWLWPTFFSFSLPFPLWASLSGGHQL